MAIPSLSGLTDKALDAFYVSVGFSVIAVDRLRGRRNELQERLGVDLSDLRDRFVDADRSPHS